MISRTLISPLALLEAVRPGLVERLMRSGLRRCDAEDVAAAVVLEMFRRGGELAELPTEELPAYAHGVARNIAAMQARASRTRLKRAGKPRSLTPEMLPALADELLAVNELLGKMPDELAEVFFYYVEGYIAAETAVLLGLPVGTVNSGLRSARAWLKENGRHAIFRNGNQRAPQ